MSIVANLAGQHLMKDIETLGVDGKSVILQVAIVPFTMSTTIDELFNPLEHALKVSFDVIIDLQDSLDAGFKIQASTLRFWAEQDPALFRRLIQPGKSMNIAMGEMAEYIGNFDKKTTTIWSRGPHFDTALTQSYLEHTYVKTPWGYNMPRDLRTFMHTLRGIDEDGRPNQPDVVHDPYPVVKHDGLYDARLQALQLITAAREFDIKYGLG